MSRSPYFFVERYNCDTKKYELQHPIVWNYHHTERICADLFPYNGCHEMFSIVENNNRGALPEMYGIHQGLPEGVAEEIKMAYDKCSYDTEYGGETHHYAPTARWFTYADMYIYFLKHPETPDYEAMDEAFYENGDEKVIMGPNPIKTLIHRVDAFLEVMDGLNWHDDYSLIRIVYWIE